MGAGHNDKAYIRTFGIANSTSLINIALAVGIDDTDNNPCKTTLITFYEAGTWVVEGKIKWFHALPLSENINMVIHGDDGRDHYDEKHFSDTVTSDTCSLGGPHVHETFDSIDDQNTDLYPTISTCDWPGTTTDCDNFFSDDIGNWTMIAAR